MTQPNLRIYSEVMDYLLRNFRMKTWRKAPYSSRNIAILGLVLLASGGFPTSGWGEESSQTKFEQLLGLVGEWEGTKPSQDGEEVIKVKYELTSKGTALVETLFPKSIKEMVSVSL